MFGIGEIFFLSFGILKSLASRLHENRTQQYLDGRWSEEANYSWVNNEVIP